MPHRNLRPTPPKAAPPPTKSKIRRDAPAEPSWPSFPGGAQYVGTSATGRVAVWVDPSLGDPGVQNAADLVADADRIVAINDAIFGAAGGPVQVIVFALGGATDGTGGADHMGCDFSTGAQIEVCASFGQSMRCSALFEAEYSECAMNGNLCGESTGEALSRWCAADVSGNALSDFATAPTWSADGMPNWVDQVEGTDQDPDSTGCGMAFLSWLLSLGYSLPQIAQAMVGLGNAGTLAQLYSALTDQDQGSAWPTFLAAVQALPFGIATDDPFGSSTGQPVPTPQPPAPAPPPAPPPPAPPPSEVTLTLAQAQAALAAGWGPPPAVGKAAAFAAQIKR